MIGCLTWPFRLLAMLLLILLIGAAWLYRDRIASGVRGLATAEPPAAVATPSPAALRSGREKVAQLARAAADSVVLDAAEAASLLAAGLPATARDRLDSIEVRLGAGRIAVSGLFEPGRLPADLVGPLPIALRERERLTVGGVLTTVRAGQARWAVDQVELRGVPLPRDLVPRILDRAVGGEAAGTVAVQLPAAVRAVRVEPQHLILYRDARP